MNSEAIVQAAYEAFEEWLRRQSDEVQELGILEQIDLYAANDNQPMQERAAA